MLFIIALILVFLLFFCLRGCEDDRKKQKVMDTNICEIVKGNIASLDKLLDRSDLCSKKWFKDYKKYIKRLEEQNALNSKKENAHFKKKQKELIKALQNFEKKQNKKTLAELEKKTKAYQKEYEESCK